MKKERITKINIKSNSGFTMTDLVAAIIIITLFTGVIGTMFYTSFKSNLESKLAGQCIYYATQISEEIDKVSYDQVKNGMEQNYISKFSIPQGFDVSVIVNNYNEGNSKEDLIKKVQITLTYNYNGNSQNMVINKLKIKEI